MNEQTDLVRRQTIAEMVEAFHQAETEIKEGYRLLETAQDRLRAAFGEKGGYSFATNPGECHHLPDAETRAERVMLHLRGHAWGRLAERLELRGMMSTARRAELDKQLQTPETLPPITDEAITGMIESMVTNLGTYYEEAVKEVFEQLRPAHSDLKTNSQYEVGEKVIVRAGYPDKWQSSAQIGYHNEQAFRNLDNVFHMLDGQGPVKDFYGPLMSLFKQENRVPFGDVRETDYFRIKICQNGNAHITLKRLDLVKRLNEVAGGNLLKHDTEARRQNVA